MSCAINKLLLRCIKAAGTDRVQDSFGISQRTSDMLIVACLFFFYREEDGQWKEDQKLEAHSDWVRDVGWAPSIGLPTSTIASCSQVTLPFSYLKCAVIGLNPIPLINKHIILC